MDYIYHKIPKDMKGTKLIALNEMKLKDKNLYEKYSGKYSDTSDRKILLKRKVPKLNCLWNDVVHLLPIHPYHVYHALTSLDVNIKNDVEFYKIPIDELKNNNNVIYYYDKNYYRGPAAPIDSKNIDWLQIDEYQEMHELPNSTLEYYEIEIKKGNQFGMFPFIPHILTQGEVSVENAAIINWNEELR